MWFVALAYSLFKFCFLHHGVIQPAAPLRLGCRVRADRGLCVRPAGVCSAVRVRVPAPPHAGLHPAIHGGDLTWNARSAQHWPPLFYLFCLGSFLLMSGVHNDDTAKSVGWESDGTCPTTIFSGICPSFNAGASMFQQKNYPRQGSQKYTARNAGLAVSLIWDVQFIPTQCFFFPGNVFSLTRSGFSNPVFFFSLRSVHCFIALQGLWTLLCPISMDLHILAGVPPCIWTAQYPLWFFCIFRGEVRFPRGLPHHMSISVAPIEVSQCTKTKYGRKASLRKKRIRRTSREK